MYKLNMSKACSLTYFPFFLSMRGQQINASPLAPSYLEPFGERWGALLPWNQPLCLYYYTLSDFSVQYSVSWEAEYKEAFMLAILLAIVNECEHCVPDKLFLEVVEENFSVTIP